MEREKEEKIRWKKTGGGGFILNGRIIKPGQVFTAYEREIPKSFRDVCVPLDELPSAKPPPPISVKKATYTVKPRGKSKALFDVVDERGKVINEKALAKEIAQRLAEDLSK